MKKIFFICFCLVFCISLIAQNVEKTTLYDEVLNGKIKTLTEKHIFKNGTDTIVYSFNELGLLTNIEKSDFSLGSKRKMINIYNSYNQKIKTNWFDQDGKESYSNDYVYEEGNLVKHIMKHPKSTPNATYYFDYEVTHYKYDKNRNLIEKKELSKQKKSIKEILKEHNKYQYDSTGNCIIEESIDRIGIVIERKNNKYVGNKLVETHTWMLFEGEDLYLKDIYEYYENEKMKSHTHIVYMYGSTKEEVHRDIENYSYDCKYDINEKLIEETKVTTRSDMSEDKSSREYSDFDDKENWRRQRIGKKIIEREIDYFNTI